MKINNCNLIGFNNKINLFGGGAVESKPVDNSDFNYNKMLHPQEVLGRSSINFTGSKKDDFVLCDDDKKFIDTTSKNLRLSDDDKQKFTNLITDFLTEKNYETLDYLDDGEFFDDFNINRMGSDKQREFTDSISDKMQFSDFDHEIFCKDLLDRVYYYIQDDEYEPEEQKYQKDFEVVEDVLSKYDMDMIQKYEIFDVMKLESETMEFDTVFDIFKPQNKSKHSITMKYINDNFPSDTAMDIIIDLGSASLKDENVRHNSINKTKLSDKFYNEQTDQAIFNELVETFDMDEDLCDEVMPKLAKRYTENKNMHQIAFEIADEYQLPSGAEKFIVEAMITLDELRNLMKKM